MRDPHRPSVWSWLTGQQVGVSFWSVPERAAGAGDCGRLDATKDWLWSPADCRQRLNFVCQHGQSLLRPSVLPPPPLLT